jgi:hypothetical protein
LNFVQAEQSGQQSEIAGTDLVDSDQLCTGTSMLINFVQAEQSGQQSETAGTDLVDSDLPQVQPKLKKVGVVR